MVVVYALDDGVLTVHYATILQDVIKAPAHMVDVHRLHFVQISGLKIDTLLISAGVLKCYRVTAERTIEPVAVTGAFNDATHEMSSPRWIILLANPTL
jgi:hypothetical protein